MQVQIQARFDTNILGIQTKPSSRSINLQMLEDPAALAVPSADVHSRALSRTRFFRLAPLRFPAVDLETLLRNLEHL